MTVHGWLNTFMDIKRHAQVLIAAVQLRVWPFVRPASLISYTLLCVGADIRHCKRRENSIAEMIRTRLGRWPVQPSFFLNSIWLWMIFARDWIIRRWLHLPGRTFSLLFPLSACWSHWVGQTFFPFVSRKSIRLNHVYKSWATRHIYQSVYILDLLYIYS
jgi:hypothetical protein